MELWYKVGRYSGHMDVTEKTADTFNLIDAEVDNSAMAIRGAVIGTDSVDRDEEIILPQGIDFSGRYTNNPVVLWNHGFDELIPFPIASSRDPGSDFLTVRMENGVLKSDAFFTNRVKESEQIFALYEAKIMRGTSVRVDPDLTKAYYKTIDKNRIVVYPNSKMIEWSFTCMGANPDTVAKALDNGRLGGSAIVPTLFKTLMKSLPARKIFRTPGNPLTLTKGTDAKMAKAKQYPDDDGDKAKTTVGVEKPGNNETDDENAGKDTNAAAPDEKTKTGEPQGIPGRGKKKVPTGIPGTGASGEVAKGATRLPDDKMSDDEGGEEGGEEVAAAVSTEADGAQAGTEAVDNIPAGMEVGEDGKPVPAAAKKELPSCQLLGAAHDSIQGCIDNIIASEGTYENPDAIEFVNGVLIPALKEVLVNVEGAYSAVSGGNAVSADDLALPEEDAVKSWLKRNRNNGLQLGGFGARLDNMSLAKNLTGNQRETLKGVYGHIRRMVGDAYKSIKPEAKAPVVDADAAAVASLKAEIAKVTTLFKSISDDFAGMKPK